MHAFDLTHIRDALLETLARQKGILFGEPALVYREMYSGRNIIARNSRFTPDYTDHRGYVPVEWWVMSATTAENEIRQEGEGVTSLILVDGSTVPLDVALGAAESELMGKCRRLWPLAKVLDIGGEPVQPSFGGEPEVPPIPFHTHAGAVIDGRVHPPGKLEAYFYLPVDVPPYRTDLGRVVTRLGLIPDVQPEDVLEAMAQFGVSDDMYGLGQVYEVRPYDGWTIRPGCLHAPGPWPTFEIQLAQDDFQFVAWRLGHRVDANERQRLWESVGLRGLKSATDLLAQAVDWAVTTDPDFGVKYHRAPQVLESGPWGRRLRIFFDEFYGEAIEVEPGQTYRRATTDKPFAGIVWSGMGTLNDRPVAPPASQMPQTYGEFLCTPGGQFEARALGESPLLLYTYFPLAAA